MNELRNYIRQVLLNELKYDTTGKMLDPESMHQKLSTYKRDDASQKGMANKNEGSHPQLEKMFKDMGKAGFSRQMLIDYIPEGEMSTIDLMEDIRSFAWCMKEIESLEAGLKALIGIPSLVIGIALLFVDGGATLLAAIMTSVSTTLMFLGGWGGVKDRIDQKAAGEYKPDMILKYLPFHPEIEKNILPEFWHNAFINPKIMIDHLKEEWISDDSEKSGSIQWDELKFQAAVWALAKREGMISARGVDLDPFDYTPDWQFIDWSLMKDHLTSLKRLDKSLWGRIKLAFDQWGGDADDNAKAWLVKKFPKASKILGRKIW